MPGDTPTSALPYLHASAGEPWPLDMTIFDEGVQTNEFGHHRGDSDNPVCMSKGAVCGDERFGPSVICCFGLSCSVDDSSTGLGGMTLYRCT